MVANTMDAIGAIVKRLLITLVFIYQYSISPLIGPRCRFYPTCSHYAQAALRRHSALKASYLIVKRLLRCHPWHPGGYDPLPLEDEGYNGTST